MSIPVVGSSLSEAQPKALVESTPSKEPVGLAVVGGVVVEVGGVFPEPEAKVIKVWLAEIPKFPAASLDLTL
jgi:hypothetical protein